MNYYKIYEVWMELVTYVLISVNSFGRKELRASVILAKESTRRTSLSKMSSLYYGAALNDISQVTTENLYHNTWHFE